jgi:hypothetical protein
MAQIGAASRLPPAPTHLCSCSLRHYLLPPIAYSHIHIPIYHLHQILDISDILLRHPQYALAVRTTAIMTGCKPIAVSLQSISCVSSGLAAFSTSRKKKEVLFFSSVTDTMLPAAEYVCTNIIVMQIVSLSNLEHIT